MDDKAISVSMVIRAPVERVWTLLVEQQQVEEAKARYLQKDPAGPPVEGQVMHTRAGPLRFTVRIKHVELVDSPYEGQTISASITVLGKEGEALGSWRRDPDHHHIQTREELKHPWCQTITQTDTHCLALDETSCVIVYTHQSEMTMRLIPRWLMARLDNDKGMNETTRKVFENYLKSIKTKAEQGFKSRAE